MSHQAVKWALYDAPMPVTGAGKPDATARQILVVLAEHADERGANSYPSPLRIRYATGLDERTIQRALLRLEHGKLIAREGVSPYGTTRWRLLMDTTRPEGDWDDMVATIEDQRRAEADARRARRHRQPFEVTGTQNPGAGTQNPGALHEASTAVRSDRDSASRRPDADSRTPGRNAPRTTKRTTKRTTHGGTLPPDPLRPQAPTSSGLGNDTENPIYEDDPLPQQAERNHRPRAPATENNNPEPLTERCRHGLRARHRTDGQSTCALCRRDNPPIRRPDELAPVIPIRRSA